MDLENPCKIPAKQKTSINDLSEVVFLHAAEHMVKEKNLSPSATQLNFKYSIFVRDATGIEHESGVTMLNLPLGISPENAIEEIETRSNFMRDEVSKIRQVLEESWGEEESKFCTGTLSSELCSTNLPC